MMATATAPAAAELLALPVPNARPRLKLVLFVVLAFFITVPCWWQDHIEADDLPSHVYNAWLSNEVEAGRVQGVYLVRQFNNVLFDVTLSHLLQWTKREVITERIAVIAAVEIFFWGCFAFVSVCARRLPWPIVPFLAILTYGAIFQLGFFNFYISVGLCLMGVALLWKGGGVRRALAIGVFVLAYTAHALPLLWAAAMGTFWFVSLRFSGRGKVYWTGSVVAAYVAFYAIVCRLMPLRFPFGVAPVMSFASALGLDQVCLFGPRYRLVLVGMGVLTLVPLVRLFEQGGMWTDTNLHFWIISMVVCLVSPLAVGLPFFKAALTYVTIRLSFFSAILASTLLARVRLRRFEQSAWVALAILFFAFLYVDDRSINRIEDQIRLSVRTLPPGARVVAPLRQPDTFVPILDHLLDRACIGYCFSFANYEAATTVFRIRALPGNRFVFSNLESSGAYERGLYVFPGNAEPLFRVFPCRQTQRFCIAEVSSGEVLPKVEITL